MLTPGCASRLSAAEATVLSLAAAFERPLVSGVAPSGRRVLRGLPLVLGEHEAAMAAAAARAGGIGGEVMLRRAVRRTLERAGAQWLLPSGVLPPDDPDDSENGGGGRDDAGPGVWVDWGPPSVLWQLALRAEGRHVGHASITPAVAAPGPASGPRAPSAGDPSSLESLLALLPADGAMLRALEEEAADPGRRAARHQGSVGADDADGGAWRGALARRVLATLTAAMDDAKPPAAPSGGLPPPASLRFPGLAPAEPCWQVAKAAGAPPPQLLGETVRSLRRLRSPGLVPAAVAAARRAGVSPDASTASGLAGMSADASDPRKTMRVATALAAARPELEVAALSQTSRALARAGEGTAAAEAAARMLLSPESLRRGGLTVALQSLLTVSRQWEAAEGARLFRRSHPGQGARDGGFGHRDDGGSDGDADGSGREGGDDGWWGGAAEGTSQRVGRHGAGRRQPGQSAQGHRDRLAARARRIRGALAARSGALPPGRAGVVSSGGEMRPLLLRRLASAGGGGGLPSPGECASLADRLWAEAASLGVRLSPADVAARAAILSAARRPADAWSAALLGAGLGLADTGVVLAGLRAAREMPAPADAAASLLAGLRADPLLTGGDASASGQRPDAVPPWHADGVWALASACGARSLRAGSVLLPVAELVADADRIGPGRVAAAGQGPGRLWLRAFVSGLLRCGMPTAVDQLLRALRAAGPHGSSSAPDSSAAAAWAFGRRLAVTGRRGRRRLSNAVPRFAEEVLGGVDLRSARQRAEAIRVLAGGGIGGITALQAAVEEDAALLAAAGSVAALYEIKV